mgnify:CR=1 FL=1
MDKTLFDLPISGCVTAPRGRGNVDIDVCVCLLCGQNEPEKIFVTGETKGKINHSLSDPNDNIDGKIYNLKCNVCNGEYQLGVLEIDSETPSGKGRCSSMYSKIEGDKETWKWLGCY